MDRTERFYRIDRLLRERRIVPVRVFLDALEISLATFKRDIEYMRDRFHAPIVWDRQRGGYAFTDAEKHAPAYELPGLWFSAGEIHALLAAEKLLEDVGSGLLAGQLAPLKNRLEQLLGSADHSAEEVRTRIRLLHAGRRKMALPHFETVAAATLKRRRLKLRYYSRVNDAVTEREVSPQRLAHYRDNWYLDAWCHTRDGIRSFAVDAIRGAELLDAKAKAVPDKDLDEELASGYGFLAVFVAAVTLRGVERRHRLHGELHAFAEQIENLLVVGLLLLLGGSLTAGVLSGLTLGGVVVAVALVFIVRPAIGAAALWGTKLSRPERWAVGFFGVRGLGSVYYLAYGASAATFPAIERLWPIVVLTVVLSIVVHGVTSTPAMRHVDRIARRRVVRRRTGARPLESRAEREHTDGH